MDAAIPGIGLFTHLMRRLLSHERRSQLVPRVVPLEPHMHRTASLTAEPVMSSN